METHAAAAVPAFVPYAAPPRPGHRATTGAPHTSTAQDLFASTREQLEDLDVIPAMDRLRAGLTELRHSLPSSEWRRVAHVEARAHPLIGQLHHAPIARRAFARPRGYPGDAETLDLVYGCGALPAPMSPLGAALYGYELQMSAALSVRARREYLAALIDEVAAERPGEARMLSVACGHLREAGRSAAIRERRVGAFYALDQDLESLALVHRENGANGVNAMPGSVRTVLRGETKLRELDLVYAAGLYDYLDDGIAARLTEKMFGMLRAGGRLVVANFSDVTPEAALMEAFMDWPLIYREEEEVARFAERIPPAEIATSRIFRDAPGNVVYLELRRA